MCTVRVLILILTLAVLHAQPATLREAADQRPLLIGAAANADEYGMANRLNEPQYASTLAAQFNMLEAENAMKWSSIHPSQSTYNFGPGDKLVAFAEAHGMKVRGHNLLWHSNNPDWVNTYAKTATPAQMSAVLEDHIKTVVVHYKGKVFAWDVVNEAIPDNPSGAGTPLRDSIWYNQPGIGQTGTGYVEQAFRWAHEADPNALLFYNEYSIEGPGAKFDAMLNMLKDFVARGVPIHGVGFQMHIDTNGYPSSAGLAQNIQKVTALGLQVHFTELDVRIRVSNGTASAADLQSQAATYQRVTTVCLQNPGCTAIQTWGFTDKYSWIPGFFSGFGAALPFDASYQAKPAVGAMIDAMQTVAPVLSGSAVVNAASYAAGAVAPGEIVTLFNVNYGPPSILEAVFDGSVLSSNLGSTRVFFDGIPAPFIYALVGQSSVVVPYAVAGKQDTVMQYEYNGVRSNSVTIPVVPSAPGIFSLNQSGTGPGATLNQDYSVNSAANPVAAGGAVQVFATGGGTIVGGATDGAVATGAGAQTLNVTATVGGLPARVLYAGPAPQLVNGVLQVNVEIPQGLSGPQPLAINVDGRPSQPGITVAVR